MYAILFIAFTFMLFLISLKKTGLLPFPTGLIFMVGVSQIMFTLVRYDYAEFNMLIVFARGGLTENFYKIHLLYCSMALFSLLSMWGVMDRVKNVRIDGEYFKKMSENNIVRISVMVTAGILFFHLLAFVIVTDWSILWRYEVYLASYASQDMVALLGRMFVSTVMRAIPICLMLAAICFCVAQNAKLRGIAFLSLMMTLAYYLILFSGHSRAAVIGVVIIGANYVVMKPKSRLWSLPILIFLVFFTLSSALEGRGGDEHGIVAIPKNITTFFSSDKNVGLDTVIKNFSEGIFAAAESLQLETSYPLRYKILAFSPLPSAIDGYSNILKTYQFRLHRYVPISGVVEAMTFGWPFFVLLMLIYLFAIRLHVRFAETRPMIFLLANFIILFSMHYIQGYPVRNGLKFLWIIYFVMAAAWWFTPRVPKEPKLGKRL